MHSFFSMIHHTTKAKIVKPDKPKKTDQKPQSNPSNRSTQHDLQIAERVMYNRMSANFLKCIKVEQAGFRRIEAGSSLITKYAEGSKDKRKDFYCPVSGVRQYREAGSNQSMNSLVLCFREWWSCVTS